MNGLVFINLCEYVKCVSTTKGYLLTAGSSVGVGLSGGHVLNFGGPSTSCVCSHPVTVGGGMPRAAQRAAQLAVMLVLDEKLSDAYKSKGSLRLFLEPILYR